jgi:hypothetical protein
MILVAGAAKIEKVSLREEHELIANCMVTGGLMAELAENRHAACDVSPETPGYVQIRDREAAN